MLGRRQQKRQGGRTSAHFDTLISSKTSISGDLHFSGGLHVDGKIKGTVRAEDTSEAVLRISEVGEVEGDVVAPHVIINGTVHGDVYASQHLELAAKASIHGNVFYNLIEMAMGAEVNGNLVHQKEPAGLLQQGGGEAGSKARHRTPAEASAGTSAGNEDATEKQGTAKPAGNS